MELEREMTEIQTKGHHLVGVEWPVIGSKGDEYTVVMQDRGFECNCPAYVKCKHIKGIESILKGDEYNGIY